MDPADTLFDLRNHARGVIDLETWKVWQKRCRTMLNRAVREGVVQKPPGCVRCGKQEDLHAHHEHYDEPLDVVWLCKDCHQDRHIEVRRKVQKHLPHNTQYMREWKRRKREERLRGNERDTA